PTSSASPPPSQRQPPTPGVTTITNIPGATNNSYTTPATSITDNGAQFQCVVSNSAGIVTSNPATLSVSAASAPSAPTLKLPQSLPVNGTIDLGFDPGFIDLTCLWTITPRGPIAQSAAYPSEGLP